MVREDKGSSTGPYSEDAGNKSGSEDASARRARLRGSLAKPQPTSIPTPGPTPEPDLDPEADLDAVSASGSAPDSAPNSTLADSDSDEGLLSTQLANVAQAALPKPAAEERRASKAALSITPVQTRKSDAANDTLSDAETHIKSAAKGSKENPASSSPVVPPPPVHLEEQAEEEMPGEADMAHLSTSDSTQAKALEVLQSIDEAMSVCATNLAALQRISGEHTNALKVLSETLHNQTFAELGLNLSSLTDSLSAALEPLKAVGELVPAIDQLVQAVEARHNASPEPSLTNEELVASLADQLSAGLLDPWTFKCAYMAIYPTEHPADLLHRLGDLLGTQKLSGDLFRAAYEAIQSADGPALAPTLRSSTIFGAGDENDIEAQVRPDEQRQEDLLRRLEEKERELTDSKEALDSRWQEMTDQYEELTSALSHRDSELKSRTNELAQKDSENQQLKAQLEELRDQTKDLVSDLQNQLMQTKETKKEPAPQSKASTGFFDVTPNSPSPFDTPAARPLFDTDGSAVDEQLELSATAPKSVSGQPAPPAPPAPQAPAPALPAPIPAPVARAQPAIPASKEASHASGSQAGGQAHAAPSSSSTSRLAAANLSSALDAPMASQLPVPANPVAPKVSSTTPTTPLAPGAGSYGSGVRAQVFEVIVRQALAGAPWKEICAGPMQVNNISPEEVEAEVKRRQALLKK